MSATEWAAIGLFAAVVLGLSIVDGDIALGLVVIVGIVVIVTTFNGQLPTATPKGTT